MFRGICFAYVLSVSAVVAQNTSPEAREIAHCGFLTFVAADQLHERNAEEARIDAMINDLIEFSSIFMSLTATEDLDEVPKITPAAVAEMTSLGAEIHDGRIASMSAANAVKLSNKLLGDCRTDLRLFEIKYRAK